MIVAWASPTAVDPELLGIDASIEIEDVEAAFEAVRSAGLEIVR